MLGADLLETPCDWQRGRGGNRGTFGAWDTADEGIPRPARASPTASPAPRAPPASSSDATAPGVAPTGKGRCGPRRERSKEGGPAIPPLLLCHYWRRGGPNLLRKPSRSGSIAAQKAHWFRCCFNWKVDSLSSGDLGRVVWVVGSLGHCGAEDLPTKGGKALFRFDSQLGI